MPDRPERNPSRGGPTYKPGESILGTVGRVVSQDLPALANRIATAWTAAGQQPASAGPPEKKPTVPPVSAGFAGPAAAPALKPAAKPEPERSDTLYPAQGGKLHSTEAGMDPDFRKNLIKAKGEAPEGGATLMGPRSGFRSLQQQKDIYNAATNKSMVAKPGGSMHGKGIAADLKYHSPEERKHYHDIAGLKAGFHFPLQGQAPGIPKEPWHAEKVGSRSADWKGFVPIPKRKPANEEKEMKKLDEFKSPWAGIDKAAADTARWRKNREEGKAAVTDAKTERKPSWLKGVVKDYISAKYGVRKEEKLDEIYPPMWAGYPAHMEKLRKERADKKSSESKDKLSDLKARVGAYKGGGKGAFPRPSLGQLIKRGLTGEETMEEDKTQTSPGVESEEHPKKFELPEKYEGSYSVRNIYRESAAGFYGGGGAGGHNVAASPGGTAASRLAAAPRPAAVRKPVAAAAPAAKPAAAPAPAAAPTPTPPAATPSAAPTQPTAPALSTTPEPAIKSSAPGPQKGTSYTTPTVNPNASPSFKGPDVNAPGSKNIEPGGGSKLSPKGLFARAQVLPTAPTSKPSLPAAEPEGGDVSIKQGQPGYGVKPVTPASPKPQAAAPVATPSLTAQGGTPTPKLDQPVTAQGGTPTPQGEPGSMLKLAKKKFGELTGGVGSFLQKGPGGGF